MNLASTISIYSGGPGSGCQGENCGRPTGVNTFDEFMSLHNGHQSAKQESSLNHSVARDYERRYYRELSETKNHDIHRINKERWQKAKNDAESAKSKLNEIKSKIKDSGTIQHPEAGQFKKLESSSNWGHHSAWESPKGAKVKISYTFGSQRIGYASGGAIHYTPAGSTKDMIVDFSGKGSVEKVKNFSKTYFGIVV